MTEPETIAGRRFEWPADYYSSPAPIPVLPRWAPYGCGAAAVVILIIVFVGGALLSGGGFAQFMDFAIGMSLGEMRGQLAPDIPASQKVSLEAEIEHLRRNIRDEAVPVTALQPFMEALSTAGSDKKITAAEARQLEETARKINRTGRRSHR